MTHLLIIAAVEIAQLANKLGVDEAVAGDEVVRQRGLPMVHMSQHADVSNALL